MAAFKLQNEFHIRAAPGIDGLIRVTHHKQVPMVTGQNICQRILILVDILKFVHHDVFQLLLPLPADSRIMLQHIQGKIHQIIKIKAVAFALFIEIAVHHLVFQSIGTFRQIVQMVHIHVDEGFHIAPTALAPADVVDGVLNGQLFSGDAQIFKHIAQDGCLILLVQNDEGGRILNHMAILLQQADAETVERGNHTQIPVRKLATDALFHLQRCLVGEGDAQDVGSGNTQFLHQIQIAAGECLGFAGAGACDNPDIAFRGGGRFQLAGVQPVEIRFHQTSLFSMDNFRIVQYNGTVRNDFHSNIFSLLYDIPTQIAI